MKKVGVVGCGLMGSGIVNTLLRNSLSVYVYDIDTKAVDKLTKKGAVRCESVQALAKVVDIMILSLPSPSLIKHLLMDKKNGALSFMKSGSYVLDMSTNDVELTRKIYKYAKPFNIDFLDCPLSGGPDGAKKGKLTIMVGGSKKAYKEISHILEILGSQVEYVGESGSGQVVKLCNNMLVGGIISLLSEIFLTGEASGVSREKISQIIQKGSGKTRVMEVFGENLLKNSFDQVKFSLDHMKKDLDLYRNLAEHACIPTLSSQSAHQLYYMASILGQGNNDSTAVYNVLQGFKK